MTTIEYQDGRTEEFDDLLDVAITLDIHTDQRDGDDAILIALFDRFPDIVVVTVDEDTEFWADEFKPEGWGE